MLFNINTPSTNILVGFPFQVHRRTQLRASVRNCARQCSASVCNHAPTLCTTFNPPPPQSAKKSQQIGEQIGGPIFRQNRLPVPWISVPGPKHTFLMVAQ